MRLIGPDLVLEEHYGQQMPRYGILSHTWGNREVTFGVWQNPQERCLLPGFDKVSKFHALLNAEYNLSHGWADTCCINKESSTELTEAINSMYRYYQNADVCIVYLADVYGRGVEFGRARADNIDNLHRVLHDICRSRWLTRGWTLQELIAPPKVEFYDRNWNRLGSLADSSTLRERISLHTGIDESVLLKKSAPSQWSIAARMSWACARETSRVEDEAYCLLGLFDVSLPLIYGEGRTSFLRLQEEIIRRSTDLSIFAWHSDHAVSSGMLFANRPADFKCPMFDHSFLGSIEHHEDALEWLESYEIGNLGLRSSMPLVACTSQHGVFHAVLNCRLDGAQKGPIALNVRDLRDTKSKPVPQKYSENDRLHLVVCTLERTSFGGCNATHAGRLSIVVDEDLISNEPQPVTILRRPRVTPSKPNLPLARPQSTRMLNKRIGVDIRGRYHDVVHMGVPAGEWLPESHTWIPNGDYGGISVGGGILRNAANGYRLEKELAFVLFNYREDLRLGLTILELQSGEDLPSAMLQSPLIDLGSQIFVPGDERSYYTSGILIRVSLEHLFRGQTHLFKLKADFEYNISPEEERRIIANELPRLEIPHSIEPNPLVQAEQPSIPAVLQGYEPTLIPKETAELNEIEARRGDESGFLKPGYWIGPTRAAMEINHLDEPRNYNGYLI